MLYFLSEVLFILAFLVYLKNDKKQNILVWIPVAYLSYECWSCFIVGGLSILHIPAGKWSVFVCNLLVVGIISYLIYKQKKIQSYYIDYIDACFLVMYACIIWAILKNRYTPELLIRFETSDPGTHLKMAWNYINNSRVSGMYFGSVSNGLFIDGLSSIFPGAFSYKAFIIKYGINFMISGWIFYAATIELVKNKWEKFIVYGVTLVYIWGYPYSDLIFGFVYLQLTITIVCYLIFVMKRYLADEDNKNIMLFMLSAGCLAVSEGYTLFAPAVFISILLCIMYKAYAGKRLWDKKRHFFTADFIKEALKIFLMPTVITVWFLLLAPNSTGAEGYGNALMIEGYIYRNFYSDFLLFIVFAVYAVIKNIKKKKITFFTGLFPIMILYTLFFAYRMFQEQISTYYFYKLNYLMWLIVLVGFVVGILELLRKEKIFAFSYLAGMFVLAIMYNQSFETTYQEKNINMMPFSDSGAFFHINTYNKVINDRQTEVSQGLVDVSGYVMKNCTADGDVIYIGNWLNVYWYEGLTNQRFPGIVNNSVEKNVTDFVEGQYGKYVVVEKNSEEYISYQNLFVEFNIVYENDFAMVYSKLQTAVQE